LNGFSHREVEVVNFLPSDEVDPSDNMGATAPLWHLTKNIFFYIPQWGSMPRKASQTVIKIARCKMEFGVICHI
jgi:hypothetical protein